MSNEPPDSTVSGNPAGGGTPDTSNNPQRRSRNRRRGRRGNPPPSSQREPSVSGSQPRVDTGFSGLDEFSKGLGLSISGRVEKIRFTPKTDGFFKMVVAAYAELCALKPSAASVLSLQEWTHVHALMLYARIANCEFSATGFKQPTPTRITLPYDLRVFQPLFAMLANLGIVTDPESFAEYIPHCDVPLSDDLSADDIGKTLDCIQYPWFISWRDALAARGARAPPEYETMAYEVKETERMSIADFKAKRSELMEKISDVSKAIKFAERRATLSPAELSAEAATLQTELVYLSYDPLTDEYEFDPGTKIKPSDLLSWGDSLYTEAKELKVNKFRPDLTQVSESPITWRYEDNTVNQNPGSYGARLGWDPKLWKDYSDFVDLVSPLSLFSLSFPKETKGTYAWLLPRIEDPSGFFVRMHKPMPTPVWVSALMLDASTLPQSRVITWYGETDRIQYPHSCIVKYVKKGIRSGLATEGFR